jgi:EAL domain-containing protein (putative c-di-GMP-specific phosphodiesterase class I)
MINRWLLKLASRKGLLAYDLRGLAHESIVPALLYEEQWVGMIYLDIVEFELTEQIIGPSNCLHVLQSLESMVRKEVPHWLKPYQLLEVRRWGDDLLIYFYSRTYPPPAAPDLANLASLVKDSLTSGLNQKCSHLIPYPITFHVGYNLLKPGKNAEKSLYTAFKEAMMIAKSQLDVKAIERRLQFKEILARKNIRIVYQPVVNLNTGEILGYEALSRGPEDTFFASPLNLFGYAQKTNQLYSLEKIAREKALAGIKETLRETKLFLNINPQVVNDPSFRPDEISDYLKDLGANTNQIVFEITERTSIDDFSAFRKSLEHYRQNGFLIAIDDAGAGYSSLQAIAEIQPDFIKIDRSLIEDIDKAITKKKLLETFHVFAQKTNSRLIAEGIETEAELTSLKSMEIPLGQGFFLARPDYPPPAVESRASSCIASISTGATKINTGRMIPVRNIVQAVPTFSVKALTREVLDFFTAYPKVEGVAVTEGEDPAGLVMRDKLFNQLGNQYGFAIHFLILPR